MPETSDPVAPHAQDESPPPRVALFVTCLVDLFRPNVGFSAVELLEQAGCVVDVPEGQSCCGQPAYNSGDEKGAASVARSMIEALEGYDYVVAPSGSCAGMVREHYPVLFESDALWHSRAVALASRTHELVSFLTDVRGVQSVDTSLNANCTYHDSCSGLRELGVQEQPRYLLNSIDGLTLNEMTDSNVCCGFGGTFCVKYPEISTRMVSDKIRNVEASEAEILLGGDMGCLMNIAGRLTRTGSDVRVFHVAEVLAGRTNVAAIAGNDEDEN